MIILTLPYPKFHRLTPLALADCDRFGRSRYLCRCDCGAERIVATHHLKSAHTRSCGCAKVGARGRRVSGTPTYNSWLAMKQRCNYVGADSFANYGGRGITVCARWSESFEAFLADMGERPAGMTIERNNTNGNYEPGNCRWATMPEQNRNRRSTILIERAGETLCVADWCDRLGIDKDVVYGRIRRGATPQEALR